MSKNFDPTLPNNWYNVPMAQFLTTKVSDLYLSLSKHKTKKLQLKQKEILMYSSLGGKLNTGVLWYLSEGFVGIVS